MAGGITYGKKHRLVVLPGRGKCLFPPRIPVNRIFRMLEQVGTRLEDQAVEAFTAVRGNGVMIQRQEASDTFGGVISRFHRITSDM
jgi:hypothetical protein